MFNKFGIASKSRYRDCRISARSRSESAWVYRSCGRLMVIGGSECFCHGYVSLSKGRDASEALGMLN